VAVPKYSYDDSLDRIADDLTFSHARTLADPAARDLAPPFETFIARVEAFHFDQRALWRTQTRAEAVVAYQDSQLDDLVQVFAKTLELTLGQGYKANPRWKHYFPVAPNVIIRMSLKTELEKIATWPADLQAESAPAIKAFSQKFTEVMASGKAAVEANSAAVNATGLHRLNTIVPMIDDINAARNSVYGQLTQRAAEQHFPDKWADRFFRHRENKPHAQSDAPAGQTG
jgi:hypothetical protein